MPGSYATGLNLLEAISQLHGARWIWKEISYIDVIILIIVRITFTFILGC